MPLRRRRFRRCHFAFRLRLPAIIFFDYAIADASPTPLLISPFSLSLRHYAAITPILRLLTLFADAMMLPRCATLLPTLPPLLIDGTPPAAAIIDITPIFFAYAYAIFAG